MTSEFKSYNFPLSFQTPYNDITLFIDGTSRVKEFFDVRSHTKEIVIKKSLLESTENKFVVCNHFKYITIVSTSSSPQSTTVVTSGEKIRKSSEEDGKKSHLCFRFQFKIKAVDGGTPARESNPMADVTIIVDRNDHAPLFIDLPYFKIIDETAAIGTRVFDVNAKDDDVVSFFHILSFLIYRHFYLYIKSYT